MHKHARKVHRLALRTTVSPNIVTLLHLPEHVLENAHSDCIWSETLSGGKWYTITLT